MRKKIIALVISLCALSACRKPDGLENHPQLPSNFSAELSATDSLVVHTPHTKAGLESLLVQAYSFLDGTYPNQPGSSWETGTDNWVFGSVAGGEAHKGSTPDDQVFAGYIEGYNLAGDNVYFKDKWQV